MTLAFEPQVSRCAIAQFPELAAQESLEPPDLTRVYVPSHHTKALHLDASVVVGMRGAGKSWWTAVLASPKHREFVSAQLQGSTLSRVTARVGFGLDETETEFPRAETLNALLDEGSDPVALWLAVVLRHALQETGQPDIGNGWRERVSWVVNHRDEVNAKLTASDAELARRGQVLLVLFDAFDRLSTDWHKVRTLSSAALQLGLQLRSRRALRLKFFIRPDFDEDSEIWRFPDSSKLRHAKVDLAWSSTDLYGLVFMHLGNTDTFGSEFRSSTARGLDVAWEERYGVYLLPSELAREAKTQQQVVEALADRYMGSSPKRGTTYTWVPLHLADAFGKISPRSYLLAFKRAAEHTASQRPDHHRALHYSAIQEGVIKASGVRVEEIAEDYPWVEPLLEAARGAVVPITEADLSDRWTADCLTKMRRAAKTRNKLPPRRYTSDPIRRDRPEALIYDLVELGVLYRTKDGRINIPDIFRVGFGIKRKGGVKPPR